MILSELTTLPANWTIFYSAETTAAATLIGLLFVAVSINFEAMMAQAQIILRIGKAFLTLAGVLFVSSLCLIPDQGTHALGIELAVLATCLWIALTLAEKRAIERNKYVSLRYKLLQGCLTQASIVPTLVGAIVLASGTTHGLLWIAAALILSIASALLDAWILLIEIHR